MKPRRMGSVNLARLVLFWNCRIFSSSSAVMRKPGRHLPGPNDGALPTAGRAIFGQSLVGP